MGEEYHIRRAAWIFTLVVVVSLDRNLKINLYRIGCAVRCCTIQANIHLSRVWTHCTGRSDLEQVTALPVSDTPAYTVILITEDKSEKLNSLF